MRLPSWLSFSRSASSRVPSQRQRRHRPCLEHLEDPFLPTAYSAASVSDLIADINAANLAGEANTITLAPGNTFTLTTGELYIAANDNLTIIGNYDTIQRNAGGKH